MSMSAQDTSQEMTRDDVIESSGVEMGASESASPPIVHSHTHTHRHFIYPSSDALKSQGIWERREGEERRERVREGVGGWVRRGERNCH